MDARATFVVEVVGELRESAAAVAERVAEALSLDQAKARALVERMPGVITKPLPEARAARVALRLQEAGLSAVHRPVSVPAAAHRDEVAPATSQRPAPAAEEPWFRLLRDPDGHEGVAPSPLHGVPSVDATIIDDVDDEPDPKLTPMTEAGFGAADIVVPLVPPSERTGSRHGRFSPPIVEGGATARPEAEAVTSDPGREVVDDLAADFATSLARTLANGHVEEPVVTMVVPPDAEPLEDRPSAAGSARAAPAPGAPPRASAPGEGRAREVGHRDGPVGERPDDLAPSARARGAIARDRAREGSPREGSPREGSPRERSARVGPRPTPPPGAAAQPADAGATPRAAHRRGAFGRRLSALITVPMLAAWALGAWFVWLLLPPGPTRNELWLPLAAATAVATLAGALAAGLAAGRIARDLARLREESERIALGDVAHEVTVRRRDELGAVAAAVERLRVSLQERADPPSRRGG
jgi:HAMP domain-containing protein